jgi:glutathione S-transferase
VHDSSTIAEYLETRYPDHPSLFGGEAGRGLARFVQNWTETVMHAAILRFVLLDIHHHMDPRTIPIFGSRARRGSAQRWRMSSRTETNVCPPSAKA